jgi:DNA repair exonuclease SbcCD ATPase subunit
MIIRKITIKNFQIHKILNLELGNFTALVGPSSAGKSSILRALCWLLYGDWDKTYPNDPEKETAIAIQLENGTVWGRVRKGTHNSAFRRRPGEKAEVYQSFKDTIPGLMDELNVKPIKIGTSSINLNFSMQDDPIFMVHESKPAKAQWIGRLYGAHILNNMLRLMAKDKRSIESDKKNVEDEEARLRKELTKYEGLEEQATALEHVDGLLRRLQEMIGCQAELLDILQDREAIKLGSHFLEADTEGLKISIARLQDLAAARDAFLSVKREEWALNQSQYLKADTTQIRAEIAQLDKAQALLDEHRKLNGEASQTGIELSSIGSKLDKAGLRITALRKTIQESLFTDGRCPLCHSKPRKLDMDAVVVNLKELARSV